MAMKLLVNWCRVLLAVLVVGLAAPVVAQDAPNADAPWQDVISSQIQAFRDHDAPAAFSFAGAGFQVTFPSAEAFFEAIVTSGYAPIMNSTSHSFGKFEKLGETAVVQEVQLIGNDQALYAAVYQLSEEENGWRVQGVQLIKQPGIAI
jgi:hypothetical protein